MKIIQLAVRKKWKTTEEKQWWYEKFSAARRLKTQRLYDQQNGLCCYCNELTEMTSGELGLSRRKLATLEHVTPQSKGGTDHASNLAMSCLACNTTRGSMDHDKFKSIRSDPVLWKAEMRRKSGLFRSITRVPKAKSKKDQLRFQAYICRLAVLFIVCPQWREVFSNLVIQRIADKKQKLLAKANRTEMDLLPVVQAYYETN